MSYNNTNNNANRPKDKFLNAKSAKSGVSKTGKNHITLSFSQEEANELLSEIQKNIENPRGVKVAFYIGKKTTNDGSREFDSGFAIVSAIQEFGANAPRPSAGKFVPKAVSPQTKAKVEKYKNELE